MAFNREAGLLPAAAVSPWGGSLAEQREAQGRAAAPAPAQAAPGARHSFAERYQPHAQDVARLCRQMLGEDDAADARSEVFLRAQRAFATYDRSRPLRTWLLAIAAHHCVDCLRRRAKEGRLFTRAELEAEDLPAQTAGPLSLLLASERQRELHAALDALPLPLRSVLALRYFAELSYAEIARALEISPGQVGVVLFRAKLRVRSALGMREGGGGIKR